MFTVDGRVAAFITRGSDAHASADVDVSRTLSQEVCLLYMGMLFVSSFVLFFEMPG